MQLTLAKLCNIFRALFEDFQRPWPYCRTSQVQKISLLNYDFQRLSRFCSNLSSDDK